MAIVRNQYVLTFSVRKLTELLEEAGFEVRPNGLRGGLIQFVSTPAEDKIYVEWAAGVGSPFERVAGDAENKRRREQEVVRPGQYL